MHDPIQKPVAEHQHANDPSSRPIFPQQVIDQTEYERPPHSPAQAVREWIVTEVEWLDLGDSGHNPHMFQSKQQKHWPQDIKKLRSQK